MNQALLALLLAGLAPLVIVGLAAGRYRRRQRHRKPGIPAAGATVGNFYGGSGSCGTDGSGGCGGGDGGGGCGGSS